jgi:hypothetical protein
VIDVISSLLAAACFFYAGWKYRDIQFQEAASPERLAKKLNSLTDIELERIVKVIQTRPALYDREVSNDI